MKYKINPGSALLDEYRRIMKNEVRANKTPAFFLRGSIPIDENRVLSAPEIYKLTLQVAEFANLCLLPRGYVERFNLDSRKIAHESVAAHTLLVTTLVDRALRHYYGPNFNSRDPSCEWPITHDGFSYPEIMETIRIHDLPENDIGDIPDNGSCDPSRKRALEHTYLNQFSETYPEHERSRAHQAYELFNKIKPRDPSSNTGNIIYLADKAASIIITLCYDAAKMSPRIHEDDPTLSERDIQQMESCDYRENGY